MHLVEKHLLVDGQPMSASLFDSAHVFHTAAALVASGSGPYFYLPKLESHLEARLWNDVFVSAGRARHPRVRSADGADETILAAFETDEILWELRDHSAGLNCGRWELHLQLHQETAPSPGVRAPDRARVTMTSRFLRAYATWWSDLSPPRDPRAGGHGGADSIKRDAP